MHGGSRADLPSLLGIWASGAGPLYDQLALAIVRLVEGGDLLVGSRLPPERDLARRLAVSRTTISSAYAKLQEGGWLERRQGAGTWVARPRADPGQQLVSTEGRTSYAVTRILNAAIAPRPGVIDLATSAFKDAHHVHQVLAGMPRDEFEVYGELGGYHPVGIPELRGAVATYLTQRGIPTALSQVVITTGVQQAAQIIFSLFAPTGHPVAVESPTFNCVIDILRMLGGVVVPLPVDDEGIVLDAIRDLGSRSNLRTLWMTSGYHNPTGVEVGRSRVVEAARIALESPTTVVENVSLRELGLSGIDAPQTVAHHAPTGSVVTVGSLSKLLSPVLRLGYIRAPAEIVRQIARQKAVWDNGSSLLPQIVAARMLPEWRLINDERRRTIAGNVAIAADAVRSSLPGWTFRPPDGGLSLWLSLPDSSNALRFTQLAMRGGVEVLPESIFHWSGEQQGLHLRISLARSREETIEGFTRLASAWLDMQDR